MSGKKHFGKYTFGTEDEILFVQDVAKDLPGAGKVYLGHRITTSAFIFPYFVKNNGLVLGISNNPQKYFQLPEGKKLEDLQNQGFLPQRLPTPELRFADILWGYLWEFFIVFCILYVYLEGKYPQKKS